MRWGSTREQISDPQFRPLLIHAPKRQSSLTYTSSSLDGSLGHAGPGRGIRELIGAVCGNDLRHGRLQRRASAGAVQRDRMARVEAIGRRGEHASHTAAST
jgi:hypothetical protein